MCSRARLRMVLMSVRNGLLLAAMSDSFAGACPAGEAASVTPCKRRPPTHPLDRCDSRGLSGRTIDVATGFAELARLFFHALGQRLGLADTVCACVVAHVLGDLHRTEFRAAHRAEMRALVGVLRQGLVVEFPGLFRIEAEVELVLPAEFETRLGKRVVARLRARMALGEIGR